MDELYALAALLVPPLTTPLSRPNNMKPICEMVEKANMRLRLVWAMAAKLPTSKEATAKMASICCQSMAKGSKPSTNKRMVMAKAANLGAPAIIKVTEVGAP